jgi:hypothetical protein
MLVCGASGGGEAVELGLYPIDYSEEQNGLEVRFGESGQNLMRMARPLTTFD